MAENTEISWCDHTFNPWEGCQKVGPGCDNCYAEARNARFGGGTAINWGPSAPRRRTSAGNWSLPLKWNRAAKAAHDHWEETAAVHGYKAPRRPRVFCASLADVFDNMVEPQWRLDLYALIRATPNLDWLLLTKRIGNVNGWGLPLAEDGRNVLPNLWIGATIVNQEEADRDIPKLLATPSAVRFLSMEPLLGPVDLANIEVPVGSGVDVFSALEYDGDPDDDVQFGTATLDWVIVGGESGPGARPMHPDWARSLRDQCAAAGVPFHFKQWGEWAPDEHFTSLRHQMHEWGEGYAVTERSWRQGKQLAGRLLDGVTHDAFPEVR